jgi:predicted ATP-grasp superfamily ATP-dependent carboligase
MNLSQSVIVLGCHVSGYGVIRALGMHGIKSIALTYDKSDFAFSSKYVSEKVVVPHPRKEADKFVELLLNKANQWKGKLIIDTDDDGAVTLS